MFPRAICLIVVSAAAIFSSATEGRGQVENTSSLGTCDPCDVNCDTLRDVQDVAPFVDVLLANASACSTCAADANQDGTIDGMDVQAFVNCLTAPLGACCISGETCTISTENSCAGLWLGPGTTCAINTCAFANLTAYRPQHGAAYFPFTKTAVSEADEENAVGGPGIRINSPGDTDPAGEDDLIEVLVENSNPAVPLAIARTNPAIRVWTTRTKSPGTEIPFTNDKTSALPLAGSSLTVWIEWAAPQHGDALVRLEPLSLPFALDVLHFHTFHSIIMSLGGEGQVPSVPVDPNNGTFVVAISLYNRGFDVHMHDEDDVTADGSGPVYDEVVNAIMHRGVNEVGIFGYSHGGGSTYDLAERLDLNRPGIGVFEIVATSYVDAVQNDSDIDIDQELRRPPSTQWHGNHYQVGTLADFFLDGGPVPNSNPSPTGLNVETTPWGTGATHFLVDDYVQVRSFIETNLAARLTP